MMLMLFSQVPVTNLRSAEISTMRTLSSILFAGILLLSTRTAPDSVQDAQKPAKQPPGVSSRIERTAAGERVVIQDIWIDAPVARVWEAFTTEKGWKAWSSPVVKIDLKAGGTIKSHYTPGAKIGDKGTNTLHIINYVPQRLLTLQAELQHNWPEVMKVDAKRLMNVLVFEKHGPNRTHVISYGVGYGDSPVYENLLKFFVPANEGLYRKLKKLLEKKPAAEKPR